MAVVYGGTTNHWRAYLDYSTSTSNTAVSITLKGGMQSVGWGFQIASGITTTLQCTGKANTSGSGGFSSGTSATVSKQLKSVTHSVSRTHSAQTITVKAVTTNSSGYMDGSSTATATVTVPAKPSYTVSYNANGGSGAPGAQTKWYGENLALSGTKPTRTGHTFKGWATSSTGGVSYASGATYTGNSGLTLYAVWAANTWTVTFNANGGTGAPGAQTKTYGKALTLSGVRPTRVGYIFLGWGTSASAEEPTYQPGSLYGSDAAATLYALWKVAYVAPTIRNLRAMRCDAEGAAADEGTSAKVDCSWIADIGWKAENIATGVVVEYRQRGAEEWTQASSVDPQATSGDVSEVIGGGLSTDAAYDVRVTVTDTGGSSSAVTQISPAYYTMDVLAGGHGVTFGGPCTSEGFEVIAPAIGLRGPVEVTPTLSVSDGATVGGRGVITEQTVEGHDYPGIFHADGADIEWLRVPKNGIIPWQQDATNGSSALGTSAWPFGAVHAKAYGTGTWNGATIPLNKGGTGSTTAPTAAAAIMPMPRLWTGTLAKGGKVTISNLLDYRCYVATLSQSGAIKLFGCRVGSTGIAFAGGYDDGSSWYMRAYCTHSGTQLTYVSGSRTKIGNSLSDNAALSLTNIWGML